MRVGRKCGSLVSQPVSCPGKHGQDRELTRPSFKSFKAADQNIHRTEELFIGYAWILIFQSSDGIESVI